MTIHCLNRESPKIEDSESESILPTFIYKSKNYGLPGTSGLECLGVTYLAIKSNILMVPICYDTISIVASQMEHHWETPIISLTLYLV